MSKKGPIKIGGYQAPTFNGINASLDGALFNDIEPKYTVERETVLHRKMQEMNTQGYTIKEIAAFLNRSEASVTNILRQPFARENMIKAMKTDVMAEMKQFLEAEVMPSLEFYKATRDNDQMPAPVRKSAADALLDRFLGKPAQLFREEVTDATKLTDEALEKEVREILISDSRTEAADTNGVQTPEDKK